MTDATLTQADIDANADANGADTSGLVVRDIPGVYTAARSGEREGWRAIRGKTWSATTVTTIVGSNPFASRMDLWRERIMGIKPVFSAFGMKIMQYGTDAEPELLAEANAWLEEKWGAGHEYAGPFTLTHGYVVDSQENPHYGCTPDGFRLVDAQETDPRTTTLELVEFKTGSKSWADAKGKIKVPQNYVDQMLWQMMVTGARRVLAVQRVVKRDRQGNVTAVLGHHFEWVEYDQARVDVLLAAVAEWEEMERTDNPPMTFIDAEDQFDDTPEDTARKRRIQEALTTIAEADDAISGVAAWETKRKAAQAVLKGILAEQKGQEVSTEYGSMGAKLSRSTRTGYDVALLTDKQRDRIRTETPVETLRITALKGA